MWELPPEKLREIVYDFLTAWLACDVIDMEDYTEEFIQAGIKLHTLDVRLFHSCVRNLEKVYLGKYCSNFEPLPKPKFEDVLINMIRFLCDASGFDHIVAVGEQKNREQLFLLLDEFMDHFKKLPEEEKTNEKLNIPSRLSDMPRL